MGARSPSSIVAVGLAVLPLALLVGCPSLGAFQCQDESECDLAGGGVCEADGRCSYPADGCPSGQRYAGEQGALGECVPEASSSSTSYASSSSSSPATDDTSEPGTSTDALPVCGNGIVEEGEACDALDDIDGDGCNVDCVESGTPGWGESYDYAGGDDAAFGLAIADDGRFVVVGSITDESGNQDAFLQLRGPDGEIRWTHVMANEDGEGIERTEQAFFDGAGGIVACGVTLDARTGLSQGWLGGLTEDGEPTWSVVLAEPEGSTLRDCEPLGDGTFLVVGTSGPADGDSGLLGRYALDGTRSWQRLHAEPAYTPCQLTSGAIDADGTLVIGGRRRIDGAWLSIVAGYTPAGELAWETPPGGINGLVQECFSVASGNGGVYAMGRVFREVAGFDGWIGQYVDGMLRPWSIESTPATGIEEFHDLVALPGGDLVIVGSQNGESHDIMVLRYDSSFELRWLQSHKGDGLDNDKAWDVGRLPDGDLLVVGYETTAAQGSNVWIQRFAP